MVESIGRTYSFGKTGSLFKIINMEKPEDMKDIMVTYLKNNSEVIRRGFLVSTDGYYNSLGIWIPTPDGHYCIPPTWQVFDSILLPHGWGGDRITHDQVLNWTYCED